MRRMEISVPSWNSQASSYTFQILQSRNSLADTLYVEVPTAKVDLPASYVVGQARELYESILQEILEKTKKYFTNPVTTEKVLRHLTVSTKEGDVSIPAPGWYTIQWKPVRFLVKAGEFHIVWEMTSAVEATPKIPAEFTATTPRAQSPTLADQPPEQTRSIQILDSLIPVGDLPLSDLPPLSFVQEETDPVREESRRRIREARLKVALAKLKAQRMEQRFYERYGQTPEDSEEESSDLTSESEADSFEPHSQ